MSQTYEKLILSGCWIYGESTIKEVHIVKSNFKAGSGDYEDEALIREEQYGEFYGIRIDAYPNNAPFHGRSNENLSEAKEYVSNVSVL